MEFQWKLKKVDCIVSVIYLITYKSGLKWFITSLLRTKDDSLKLNQKPLIANSFEFLENSNWRAMIWLHVLFLCCILARAADYLIARLLSRVTHHSM